MYVVLHRWLITFIALLCLSTTVATFAQAPSKNEVLGAKSGEVFEMIVQSDLTAPEYSWILSKDTELKKATNSNIFSVRFTETGNYVLQVQVLDSLNQRALTREFYIRVQDATGTPVVPNSFTVYPPLDEANRLPISQSQQVIIIRPHEAPETQYTIDLNTDVDSDGDGDAANDQYARDSLFSTSGTPLRIWLAQQESTGIAVHGTTELLRFDALTPADLQAAKDQQEQDEEFDPAILITRYSTNQYGFSIDASNKEWQNTPVLFEWNLGDGTETLHDTPIHTFSSQVATMQQISVQVRSLQDGTIIDTLQTKVDLEAVPITSSSSSSMGGADSSQSSVPIASSSDSSEPTGSDSENSSLLGLIIKIVLIALGSVLAGFLIVFVFGLFKRIGGVQGAIEKSEEKLLNKKADSEVIDAMPLPEQPEEAEVVEDNDKDTTNKAIDTAKETAPEPTKLEAPKPTNEGFVEPKQTAPLPSWLQTDAGKSPPPKQPEPKQESITSEDKKPDALPKEEKTPVADSSSKTAPLPSWLQPDSTNTKQTEQKTAPRTEGDTKNAIETADKKTEVANTSTESTPPPVIPKPSVTAEPSTKPAPEPKEPEPPTQNTVQEESKDAKDYEIDPAVWATLSEEEKERERKRLKRKRYRANKKQRDKSEQSSEAADKQSNEDTAAKTSTESQSVSEPSTEKKTPGWLAQGLDAAAATGQTQDSLPPKELKEVPLANKDVTPNEPDDIEFIVRAESLDDDEPEDETKKA